MNVTPAWLHVVAYRLGQVRQQLGFVPPLSSQDKQEVQRWLPPSALPLFDTMSTADQQHSLRVCRGLQAQGCVEHDMLAASLLHDIGKAQGRVPFWTRPVIVLGKLCVPNLLMNVVGTDLSRPMSGLGGNTLEETHLRRDVAPVPPPSLDAINRSLPNNVGIVHSWRRALSYAWWHAEVGADLAAVAGLSERAVLYIRTHHEPHGPAAELHRVDEVS